MKATKKIVGAACALVAAVALSAGSTFAWFSSNDKVEVTGMHLQAVVPDALFIKEGIVTDVSRITDTSLTYNVATVNKLKPATIKASSTAGTYVIQDVDDNWTSEPTGNSSGTPGGYVDIGTFNNSSTTFAAAPGKTPADYAQMYVMSVARINDKQGAKLEAEVVLTFESLGGDFTFRFVRCGFLSKEGWVSIENTVLEKYCEYQTGDLTVTFRYMDNFAVVKNFNGNTAYPIQFVLWFDGPDEDCYASNAKVTNEIEVQITYSVNDGN